MVYDNRGPTWLRRYSIVTASRANSGMLNSLEILLIVASTRFCTTKSAQRKISGEACSSATCNSYRQARKTTRRELLRSWVVDADPSSNATASYRTWHCTHDYFRDEVPDSSYWPNGFWYGCLCLFARRISCVTLNEKRHVHGRAGLAGGCCHPSLCRGVRVLSFNADVTTRLPWTDSVIGNFRTSLLHQHIKIILLLRF